MHHVARVLAYLKLKLYAWLLSPSRKLSSRQEKNDIQTLFPR